MRDPTSSGRRPIRSHSRPAGTWTAVLTSSGPAMNRAITTGPPPWAATYRGAMGKMAAIPVNMTTWPDRSQKTGPSRCFGACCGVTSSAMGPILGPPPKRRVLAHGPVDYDGCMAVGFTPVDDDLYREIILDHYRNPRHRKAVEPADHHVEANNP